MPARSCCVGPFPVFSVKNIGVRTVHHLEQSVQPQQRCAFDHNRRHLFCIPFERVDVPDHTNKIIIIITEGRRRTRRRQRRVHDAEVDHSSLAERQMPAPPHSLHSFLRRWCGQMSAPPALLAFVPLALVVADARAPALLASAPSTIVLTDALYNCEISAGCRLG